MIRGTTPTNTFTVTGVDLTDAKIYLTYAQNGKTLFEKTEDDLDVTVEAGLSPVSTLVAKLTQAETLQMSTGTMVRIQLRAIFSDGTTIATKIVEKPVGEILKDEEISYD